MKNKKLLNSKKLSQNGVLILLLLGLKRVEVPFRKKQNKAKSLILKSKLKKLTLLKLMKSSPSY